MKILKNIINVVLILIIDICVYKVYIKSTEYKKQTNLMNKLE